MDGILLLPLDSSDRKKLEAGFEAIIRDTIGKARGAIQKPYGSEKYMEVWILRNAAKRLLNGLTNEDQGFASGKKHEPISWIIGIERCQAIGALVCSELEYSIQEAEKALETYPLPEQPKHFVYTIPN